MNVYVWTNSLKNAYIGEYIVPTSWLLWYRPLQSDLKDLSWNGNNGTRYWTWAFDTVLGKTWARVTTTGTNRITASHIETPLIYWSIPITFCFWADIYTQWGRSWIISNANYSDDLTDFCLRTYRTDYILVASLWNWNNNQISTYSLNTWVFYAITIDSSWAWKLYKNWTLSNSWTWANTATNSWYWWIWARNSWGWWGRWIDGLMRHCAIYNRALTDAEILEFYNQTA